MTCPRPVDIYNPASVPQPSPGRLVPSLAEGSLPEYFYRGSLLKAQNRTAGGCGLKHVLHGSQLKVNVCSDILHNR